MAAGDTGGVVFIPVYFIGKELFGRWAGVISAGLISILPGEFLGRSILGFTDTHIAETLFSTVAMMFLIMALKRSNEGKVTFEHIRDRDWGALRKPVIFSLLAALSMGIYIYTWLGALLFVLITFGFFVVQFVIDYLKGKSTDYLCIIGAIFFVISLLAALLVNSGVLYIASLMIAIIGMLVLGALSRVMVNKKLTLAWFPLSVLGLGVIAIGGLYLLDRGLFNVMVNAFSIFHPTGASLTTVEMQPLISPMYGNRWVIAWGNFNVGFFLSFVSFLVLIYLIIKNGDAGNSLLWIWSVVMLVATLGQRRFGYYYSVNVALLTGYLWWKAYEASGQKWLTNILEEIATRRKSMKLGRRRSGSSLGLNYAVLVLASLVCLVTLFFGAFFWNIEPALAVASTAPYAPSDAWVASLDWLRQNSPEPLGSADAYYKVEPALTGGQTYQYPDTAYGVLAWWDYGYWITRIAHRIPNANPSQDPKALYNVASFFTSQNETAASEIRQQLGSEYLVIDQDTALSKFGR